MCFVRSAFVLFLVLVSSPAHAALSDDVLNAPATLSEVDGFRWYIVTSEDPACPVDLRPAFSTLLIFEDQAKDLDITYHEGGGASDVFLLRYYVDTLKIKVATAPTCLLVVGAELGYFDRIEDEEFSFRKLILWDFRSLYKELQNADGERLRNDLSNEAAGYVAALMRQLLQDISAAKPK